MTSGVLTYSNAYPVTADTQISFSERFRIDSSGNVGIGTSNPVGQLTLNKSSDLNFLQAGYGISWGATSGSTPRIIGSASSDLRFFHGGGSEAMRIDTSGRVLINGTQSTSNTPLQVNVNGGNGSSGFFGVFYNGANLANQTAGYYLGRTNNSFTSTVDGSGNPRDNIVVVAGASGGVQLTSGSTSWSAFSDERYKTIEENITNGLDKISNWRTVIGRYNSDDVSKRRSFLIAQDVEQTFPEAVITQDSGQETEQKYLSYTDTIPVLVKALQEAKTKIETLEAKVTALETTN